MRSEDINTAVNFWAIYIVEVRPSRSKFLPEKGRGQAGVQGSPLKLFFLCGFLAHKFDQITFLAPQKYPNLGWGI